MSSNESASAKSMTFDDKQQPSGLGANLFNNNNTFNVYKDQPRPQLPPVNNMSSMLSNGVVPPGVLPPLDHYRLQLYNYAMNVERLRCSQYGQPPAYPPGAGGPYGPRFSLSMALFPNRIFQPDEPKPQHSYIGLIAMAILGSPDSKLVLSDIYQHILDNYPYFRTRGPGWRNSIRHNLSLNDCFIKSGRSANGKGHYWAIHPANIDDFRKGDFRRRKAQRKVRKHMGLAVDDDGADSLSPPPLSPPPALHQQPPAVFYPQSTSAVMANIYSQTRKRQFDVASLLAPDEERTSASDLYLRGPLAKRIALSHSPSDLDEDIDVVASDIEDEQQRQPPADIPQPGDTPPLTPAPSTQSWQGLVQQWPNDTSILSRYYSQYMAAAAAQHVVKEELRPHFAPQPQSSQQSPSHSSDC